jgi:hypothetical protein
MTNHTPRAVERVPRRVIAVMGSLKSTKAIRAVVGGVR